LSSIKDTNLNFFKAIDHFKKLNYNLFILYEQGQDFFTSSSSIKQNKNNVFIIGSQEDEFLSSKELSELKIPMLSIGNQSYLASSVIRLLKLHLLAI
jgi:tRNA pseudouridine-54 N-methylase